MSSARITELDALRGIAAIAVVLFHYTYRLEEVFNLNIFQYRFAIGHYGVELFFAISGFVIFMTTAKIKSVKVFFWKRFLRLYPTFLICMLLTYLATSFFEYERFKVNPIELMVNFTMLPSLFDVKAVDGVYWTLKVEVIFYCFIAALLFFNQLKNHKIIGAFFLLFCVIVSTVYKFHTYIYYGTLFLLGIYFYTLWQNKKNILIHTQILVITILPIVFGQLDLLIVNSVITLLFYLLIFNLLKFIAFKPLLFIGQISYALYLVHQFIGYIIIMELNKMGISNQWILLLIPIVFSILIASLVSYIIEPKVINQLNLKFSKN